MLNLLFHEKYISVRAHTHTRGGGGILRMQQMILNVKGIHGTSLSVELIVISMTIRHMAY